MPHMYFPSVGQADKVARSAALGTTLVSETMALEPRYASRITTLPCVIIDHGGEIAVVAEPTTVGALTAAHDALLANYMPSDVPRVTDVVGQITTHSGASNPHGITPANIGASSTSHTHSYEAAGAVATHAGLADPHPGYLTPAEHAATDHTGITGVGGGGGATGGVIRKTAAQTVTATAQTAIADASFAVAINSKYYFIMYVAVTTSTGTAPTTAYGVTGPAGATVAITLEQDTSTSVEASGVITAFGNFAAGAQVANTGAEVRGVVETGATAGTVQLTAARAGTTPSMVIPIGGVVGFWMKL